MLPEEKVKALAKKIDEIVDWKKITGKPLVGAIMEAFDNWGIPAGLQYVNEKLYDKLPDTYEASIEKMIDAFLENDYDGVLDVIPDTIDSNIDLAAFDDDFEALWIATNWDALLKFIRYYALKNKE